MLTLPPLRFDGSMIDAGVSTNADTRAPAATFSQAAKAHRIGAAILDTMIEEIPVGLLVLNGDGEVTFANAAARALRAESVPSLRGLVSRALRSDRVLAEVFTVGTQAARTRLDSRRSLAVRVMPVSTEGARAHAVVVTVNDITAQVRADAWEPAIASLMSL